MHWVWVRFGPPLVALRGVAGSPALRRASVSFLLFSAAEAAAWTAILVFAFQRGGAAATGLVGLLLLVPAAVVAPVTAALGDRRRRERVLAFGYLTQGVAVGVTALAIALDAPAGAVYAGAVVAMAAMTTSRPAHHALVPGLASTPAEVAAANSVSSLADGGGATLGTIGVAVLLAVGDVALVYAAAAAALVAAALAVLTMHAATVAVGGGMRPWTLVAEAGRAFAAIARERSPRLLVALAASITVAWGAFDVLLVSVAIERLGIGESGVGVLQTAAGAGGLVGAATSIAFVGRPRLWSAFVAGSGCLAVGIAAASSSSVTLVVAAIAVAGGALTLVDVIGRTLLQRVVDDAVLTRVFGVIEMLWMGGVGLGSGLAGALSRTFGLSTSLLVVGTSVAVLTLPAIRGLRRIDRETTVPERAFRVLRELALFEALPRPELERLASQLDRLEIHAGDVVVVQGEIGDRLYVVDSGTFEVLIDGTPVRRLGEGEAFGEIALLHDVPRTATVRALADGAVWTLDQEEFLATVTGQPQVASAAHAMSAERLRDRGADA